MDLFNRKRIEALQGEVIALKQTVSKAATTIQTADQNNAYYRQLFYALTAMKGGTAFNYDLSRYAYEYYVSNPHGYRVINKKNAPCEFIPWLTYIVKDKPALEKYKAFTLEGRAEEAKHWASKALEQVEGTPMDYLFNEQANRDQTFGQYVVANLNNFDINGNEYTLYVQPSGFKYYTQVHTLPAHNVEIIIGDYLNPVKHYKLFGTPWGVQEFLPEFITHRKRFNPGYRLTGRVEDLLYGLSPFAPLDRTLKRSNHALDGDVSTYEQGRPAGILTDKAEVPMRPEDQKELRSYMDKEFGGGENKGKIMFSSGSLEYVRVGANPDELQALEAHLWDLKTTAGIFDLPIELVTGEKSSYNNMNEAEKAGWVNCRIPSMIAIRDTFNRKFTRRVNEVTKKEYWCDPDFSNVPCLAEDKKTKSEMHLKERESGMLTENMYRKLMNMEENTDPNADRYVIRTSLRFTDEETPQGQTFIQPGNE